MIKEVGQRKICLFEGILFVLVILCQLPQTYVFSQMDGLDTIINLLQLVCYVGLVVVILENNLEVKRLLLIAGFALLFLIGYLKSGQAAYFRGVLLIVAAAKFPYKRIIRICKDATLGMFVLTVVLWILGISDSGIGRRGKVALGYVHPNIAAQIVVILVLLYCAEKGSEIRRKDYILIELAAAIIYLITDSKTAVMVLVIAPIVIEITKFFVRRQKKYRVVCGMLTLSQLFVVGFTYLSAILLPYSGFLKKLDLFLTTRLFLNYYLLKEFGMKLFGQNVLSYFTGSVYNDIHDFYGAVITCDNTYALSLIVMGIIPTLLAVAGYFFIIRKALKNRDYMVIATAILLSLYAFCECQLTEIYKYFIYFYLFAKAMENKKSNERRGTENDSESNKLLLVWR